MVNQNVIPDVTKLTGDQIARAMHAARKIQLSCAARSPEWINAASIIDSLTAENRRRLLPDEVLPVSSGHVARK